MEGIFWNAEQFRPRAVEQAVAPDASTAWLSSNFLAPLLECLSLGAGEQQRSTSFLWEQW
jgi:hypothetical protein